MCVQDMSRLGRRRQTQQHDIAFRQERRERREARRREPRLGEVALDVARTRDVVSCAQRLLFAGGVGGEDACTEC